MKYLLNGQKSTRLTFRTLKPEDFDTWLPLFHEKEVGKMLGFGDIPSAKLQCEQWFGIQQRRYANNLGGMNVLVENTTQKFVGQCGLLIQEIDNEQHMEIGYSILPSFRNKGYASEAAQKCRNFAFENNFTDTLISIIHIKNIRSEKVALKNGMKKWKQTVYKDMPVNIYKIEKRDWIRLKNI